MIVQAAGRYLRHLLVGARSFLVGSVTLVATDANTLTVPACARTLTVAACERTLDVPACARTLTIPKGL